MLKRHILSSTPDMLNQTYWGGPGPQVTVLHMKKQSGTEQARDSMREYAECGPTKGTTVTLEALTLRQPQGISKLQAPE